MFLSKISIHSCMSTHYIVQENIFVIIVQSVLEQQKQLACHIKGCFKTNGKERVKLPKKGEYVRVKNYERKVKSLFMLYVDFESILVPEDNGKQNLYTSLIQTNIKKMLLAVMAMNQYVLIINLVSLLSHTYVKMLFTILLIV